MKLLYISHHRQASGWGQAARDYIKALKSVDVPVAARAIHLSGSILEDVDEEIVEAEAEDSSGCTHCIQHLLPQYMAYDSRFEKCVGIVISESTGWNLTRHPAYYNLMDELWAPDKDTVYTWEQNGLEPYIKHIPHACDLNKYYDQTRYEKLNIPELNDGSFNFYFIGEFNRRKNLPALLRAFNTEFDHTEPVRLVIKTSKEGMSPEQLANEVNGLSTSVKKSLKMYRNTNYYHQEIVITDRMPMEKLMGLHKTCHCLVAPSFGEAWHIPAFEAMAMGNHVIATNTGGPKDYLDNYNLGYRVNAQKEPLLGMTDTFEHMGSAREKWDKINIYDLQLWMRHAYENKDKVPQGSLEPWSYQTIGNKMKENLEWTAENF